MKKLIFSLALLLMSVSAALAQTWAFNERDPFIGDADEDLINADATNWYNDANKSRYNFFSALDNAALTANGTELNFAKGLLFKCNAGTPSQSSGTPAEQNGKIRLNYGGEYLELNGTGIIVTIPNVKQGWVVTVVCKSAKSKTARGLYVSSNVGGTTNFNTKSANQITCTGTVSEAGDVTLTTNDGGMLIYSISVKDPSAVEPEPVDPDAGNKVNNAVSRDTYKNQMFVTTNSGSVKYYNTEDLSKVSFEGDKTVVTPLKSGAENDEYDATVKEISFAKKAEQGQDGTFDKQDGVVEITEAKGWQESAYLKWKAFDGATSYNVYVDGKKIDAQLVRKYTNYYRADVLGLKAGDYSVKVVPVKADGTEIESAANTATGFAVKSYDRSGFAHFNYTGGIGAYNNDGTLKAGAKVLYITAQTAKTVSTDVILDKGKAATKTTGLQAIIDAYQKGNDPTPIAFRFIGKVSLSDLDKISSSSEGIQVKGKSGYTGMSLTFEGVGEDATVHGFGFLVRNAKGIEFRNFAIMNCLDDALSLDTQNQHVWIHNMDFFYGQAGGDKDQAKGDGTVDLKGNSQYITIAYNRFWDSGKSSLCGMKSESNENWITYHHNWFDHSDSRHPRIRTMSVHVYNNYFDGNSKYGVGATSGSSAFVESNYFRNAKDPMMISGQGTDAKGDGTFSGETGGMIKEYGNIFAEKSRKFQYVPYSSNNKDFDCYDVANRNDKVPADVKTVKGGTSYNNFDTDPSLMYEYTPDAAVDVPAKVTGFYGAGRLNHGDLQWTFDNSVDDDSYAVNSGLKTAVVNYKNTDLLEIGGNGTSAGEGGGGTVDPGTDPTPDPGTAPTPTPDPGIDPTPTPDPGTDTPTTPEIEGTVTCTFVGGVASNSSFTVKGSQTNKKSATIDGTTYESGLKFDSDGSVSFSIKKKMTMTMYFASDDKKCTALINGKKTSETGAVVDTTKHTLTVVLEADDYTLTKQDTGNLFMIKLVPVTE